MDTPSAHLPPKLREILAGYRWLSDDTGRSGAHVVRLVAEDRPSLFLKTEQRSPFEEPGSEAARLLWLASTGLPCPEVLHHVQDEQYSWLVLTALPGTDLACASLAPSEVIRLVAGALTRLHALDPARCPFDQRVASRIEAARQRTLAGMVDESDFGEEHLGQSAASLMDRLLKSIPGHEDLVVTHGDATLSNLIASDAVLSGFIDVGRLGVADRHQDLALAARDIAADCGREWVEPFLRLYGHKVEPTKMAFYELLDEFF